MASSIDWGTIPAWVSGIGTTLAFTATFIVIRLDANVRRVAQARESRSTASGTREP